LLVFAKHSLDSISLEIVSRHALSYVLVQVTANAPLVQVKWSLYCTSDRQPINGNPDSCLCERNVSTDSAKLCRYCYWCSRT